MGDVIVNYQWEIFISLEVLATICLIAFLVSRYALKKDTLSRSFLIVFLGSFGLEAILAWVVYQQTGEISTFQIVIAIFIVYACTFGISDFKHLDRYIKLKIGQWRNVDLLTDEEKKIMAQAKDPNVIAKRNRRWWYTHALAFFIVHYIFWIKFGNHGHDFVYYLTDLSWWEDIGIESENSPFTDEFVQQISKVWVIIFVIDTVISWSYTIFPAKKKHI